MENTRYPKLIYKYNIYFKTSDLRINSIEQSSSNSEQKFSAILGPPFW